MNLRDAASKGGYARAAKMTPEERSAVARKAGQARWARPRKARSAEELIETWTVSHIPAFTFSYFFR